MASLTNESVIAFFDEDRNREERRHALHGEVPDVFRTHFFHLHVKGENWAHSTPLKTKKMHAKLYVTAKGSAHFHRVLTTEVVRNESNPQFTSRVPFNPLSMENSQNEAMETVVKIEAFVNESMISSPQFPLAPLLWDFHHGVGAGEQLITPLGNGRRVSRTKRRVTVDVSLGRAVDESCDGHDVKLIVSLGDKIWTETSETKVFFVVNTVSGHGGWTRSYVSEIIRKPFNRALSVSFQPATLKRGDLTCYKSRNPIRIELRGSKSGYSKSLGFSQFLLAELLERSFLSWSKMNSSSMWPYVAIRESHVSLKRSEVHIEIGAATANDGKQMQRNPKMNLRKAVAVVAQSE